MNKPNIKQGIYRHYKGNEYEVIDVVRHSETQEWMVLYRALYGDFGLWVRPFTMFTEEILVHDVLTPRFKWIKPWQAD